MSGPSKEVPAKRLALRPAAIEKVFTDCAIDLKRILVLDGIDGLSDGFRIRCHDLYGPLPEIVITNTGDTFDDKEQLRLEVCKITAIVKLRDQMIRFLPGARFLPPTRRDGMAVAGLQARPKTWIMEGKDFLEAYHQLHTEVVG
jgi:hypothetical protein